MTRIGQYISNHSSLSSKNYGYARWSDLIRATEYFEEHEGENHLFGEHRHSEWETEHRLTAVKWSGNRWLGAAAMSAVKITDDPEAGVREFENLTNQSASDLGCNCCGQPHNFSYEDDAGNNRYMDISVKTSWSF